MEGTKRIRRVNSLVLYLTTPPDLYTLEKKKVFNGLLDTVKPSHGNVGLSKRLQLSSKELMAAATDLERSAISKPVWCVEHP